ncbi:MAG: hypothetical protein GDA50_01280 [Alphaproteobacteria bacterium GM202ARS2]|nr:hypothetical protein [Alphaproteobacteria bacterium GM202ARS2]
MCNKKGELLCPQGVSALGAPWHRRWCDENTERTMMQRYDLSTLAARVLTGRAVDGTLANDTDDDSLDRLDGAGLDSTSETTGVPFMAQAAERIASAIKKGKRIGIITDYDVDGASAAAVLCHYLRDVADMQLDTHIYVYVPDRLKEGFGPNENALAQLSADGVEVLFVLDCGSNAYALLGGLDDKTVVIIDHHQLWRRDWGQGGEQEQGCWLVNPHNRDITEDKPFIDACAAVLVFLFVLAVNRCLRAEGGGIDEARLRLYSGFVALAVVCDMVPMRAYNHRLAREGLRVLNSQEAQDCYSGVRALWRLCQRGGALDEDGIAFALGPRLNAGSRMGQSRYAFEVMMGGQDAQAKAESLDTLNQHRRRVQEEATQRLKDDPAAVVWDDKGAVGCIGLVAAARARMTHKPSFVFAPRSDGLWVGSARHSGQNGCDIGAWVHEATEQGVLKGGGGHAAAAGMQAQDIDQLRDFRQFIDKKMQDVTFAPAPVLVDGVLGLPLETNKPALNFALWQDLQRLRPWGRAYGQPHFMLCGVVLEYIRFMGEGKHLSCRLRAHNGRGGTVEGTVFDCHATPLGAFLEAKRGAIIDVVGVVACDSYGGYNRLRLQIEDARPVTL